MNSPTPAIGATGKSLKDIHPSMNLAPIPDERILRLDLDSDDRDGPSVALVVAELHLGLETKLHRAGAHVASGTTGHAGRILNVALETGASRLIIAGDLKESIPLTTHQERRDVPEFLSLVSSRLEVHIIPGNHDAGLDSLIPKHHDIIVHPSDGVRFGGTKDHGGVGIFHGHAWPDADLLRADELIAAHTHPVVALVDPLGHAHTEPCWVRAPLDPDVIAARYGEDAEVHATHITLVPPFNPLLGGAAVNVDGLLGPGGKMVNLAQARLYLLDGTDLGTINHLPEIPEKWIKKHRVPKSEDL
jgi:uncharacterized protein